MIVRRESMQRLHPSVCSCFVRVDTHLHRADTVLALDFETLLAKVIVVATDWDAMVVKARRVLQDTVVEGLPTLR